MSAKYVHYLGRMSKGDEGTGKKAGSSQLVGGKGCLGCGVGRDRGSGWVRGELCKHFSDEGGARLTVESSSAERREG